MNRFAKKFRVLASLCVLCNLSALFFPAIVRVQENYPDVAWTQLNYIKSAFAEMAPSLTDKVIDVSRQQAGWTFLFMVLPLVVSLIAGILGIIGSPRQKASSILVFVILLFYLAMMLTIEIMKPELADGQDWHFGLACTLTLIFSGCGAVFSIAALAATPKKIKVTQSLVPQAGKDPAQAEAPQQTIEPKYHVSEEKKPVDQESPAHGVLVGVKGLYVGAEIPITDGNAILLGRGNANHLVFAEQMNVSRKHCRVKWDQNRQKYIFHDYSNTGTYLEGKEDCLPQNLDIELNPGTTIALGNARSNIFFLK